MANEINAERLKGILAWLEGTNWWAAVKAHVVAEAKKEEQKAE